MVNSLKKSRKSPDGLEKCILFAIAFFRKQHPFHTNNLRSFEMHMSISQSPVIKTDTLAIC